MVEISEDQWKEWIVRHSRQRNAEDGKPWFLSAPPVPEPERHTPSQSSRCHRKIFYQAQNAPEENPEPRGIFFIGRKIERDLILPFLKKLTSQDRYVGNDLNIYFQESYKGEEFVYSGETDPVILDDQGNPIALTEIKSTAQLPDSPHPHHVPQLYTYIRGLNKKFDSSIEGGWLIYVARENLALRPFWVKWEESQWKEILSWCLTQTQYRREQELPPPDPVYEWECSRCPFEERCSQDMDAKGLADEVDYPRGKLLEALSAHQDFELNPDTARKYPEIAQRDDVQVIGWRCKSCESKISWDHTEVPSEAKQPLCPDCSDRGNLGRLVIDDKGASQDSER